MTKEGMAEILSRKATHRCVSETEEIHALNAKIAELEKALAQANFNTQEWTAQANQLTVANDQKAGQIVRLRGALAYVEWNSYDEHENEVCPSCDKPESLGKHADDCILYAALASTEPKQ